MRSRRYAYRPVATLPSALRALMDVIDPAGDGVYASAGDLFRYGRYGRDSLEAAEDLLQIRPELVRSVIASVVRRQGTHDDPPGPHSTEQEVGRVHHEDRQLLIGGNRVPLSAANTLARLARRWGGTAARMTYYGTTDATPLYVRLVACHCKLQGTDILDDPELAGRPLLDHDGRPTTVRASVLAAVGWVERQIRESERRAVVERRLHPERVGEPPGGLLEFCRRNPDGIEFQVWKDGGTSLIHPNGHLADYRQPIATIELQGLAYDALVEAADLFEHDLPEESARWRTLAHDLRERTLRAFWMPHRRYFAMAIDRDEKGCRRQVTTVTSSPLELLDTRFFDGLPPRVRQACIEPMVRMLTGPEFLTDAGVRCTALRHRRMLDHWQYQGVFTSWFKSTHDIARGLRRQGFGDIAQQLETRILNAVNVLGDPLEFVFVDGLGRMIRTRALEGRPHRVWPRAIAATNVPDSEQTWTITAVLAIKWRRGRRLPNEVPTEDWAVHLQDEVLARMHRVQPMARRLECMRERMQAQRMVVDRALGKRREARVVERSARRFALLGMPGAIATSPPPAAQVQLGA